LAVYSFCLIRMELTGPCIYRKETFKNLKNFQIYDASLEYDGKVTPLPENNFYIEHLGSTLYIHHEFRFIDEYGNLCGSGWRNKEIPLDTFKTMKNLFRHLEDGIIFRIFFTEKAAEALRTFVI